MHRFERVSEKTADCSVTVTNSNELLTGRALSRLNCGVAHPTIGRKRFALLRPSGRKRNYTQLHTQKPQQD